jgi:hypothetical protein
MRKMADIEKVRMLKVFDMVVDKRRSWYVVEWKDKAGHSEFLVDSEMFPIVAQIDCAESDMVCYLLLSHVGASIEEVKDYIAAGNSRLGW